MCFCGLPKYTRTLKSARSRPGQNQIRDVLKQDSDGGGACSHRRLHSAIKILLLGAPGCGKSTVIRKLRQCYGGGISLHEKEQTRSMVFSKIYETLACAIHQLQAESRILCNEKYDIDAFWNLYQNRIPDENNWNEELLSAMRSLCRRAIIRVTALEILGTMTYTQTFISAYDQTLRLDWIPTEADVMQFYVPTTKLSCTWINKDIFTLEINTDNMAHQDLSEILSLADAIVCVVDISRSYTASGICSASEQICKIMKLLERTMGSREMLEKPMQLLLNQRAVVGHEESNLEFPQSAATISRNDSVQSILQCFLERSGHCGEICLRQIYALSTTWMIGLIHDWRQMMLYANLHEAGIL